MYSFSFPKMFNYTTASLLKDKEAVRSNMLLLLSTELNTLFGDPYFGCELKKYIFEQSNSILVDILVDHIYTTIITFMPQVTLKRSDITIYSSETKLFAEINYTYIVDKTSDLFIIKLTESSNDN